MKLCRFVDPSGSTRPGLIVQDTSILDLGAAGFDSLAAVLETEGLAERLASLAAGDLPRYSLAGRRLLAPADRQEVWGAGVTYATSKQARMDESDFCATAYAKVYDAAHPRAKN